jgi:Cft2 family RNA processing exonuclease
LSARLIAISGLGPKEPAAFVVEADGRRLLLDCGEGPEPGRLPDFDAIGHVEAILLSHSHADHAGALRFRDRIGNPPVFASPPVLARLKDVHGEAIPMRGRAEVLGVAIETGTNGHAPGGIWLRLAVGEGLLYMGDHSQESQLYVFDRPPPTATMIIDGSYGDAETSLDAERTALAALLKGGPALLPMPADGRGPDIAMFLQEAGFDVVIDDATRAAAVTLMYMANTSARNECTPRLLRLVRDARPLDANSEPRGAMVAHGGSGDIGVPKALIARWGDASEPMIVFTGHLAAGTTGRRLVDNGRAKFQRWNVHPRLSDNLRLVETVNPKRVIPAFGEARHLALWRERVAPRELVTATPIEL